MKTDGNQFPCGLFVKNCATIDNIHETFLAFLPPAIEAKNLRVSHFQIYINHRQGQLGRQTKQPVKLGII
jgi:hypothetical protein